MTKHYADTDGNYLGGFGENTSPPKGAIRTTEPNRGDDVLVGGVWRPNPVPPTSMDCTHTRREFMLLLTDTMEDEINAVITTLPRGKQKRALRAWWLDEQVFRWDDPEMIKLRRRLKKSTVTAMRKAWVG
ncbi:MAG: hypothetical protein COA53_06390 [Rhodobacteraceae bacterium]|nr:MAG: hypothetical protein COA53_06390 [Paracoccaceae bacterium]